MADLTEGLIIWFPANNRNFSSSESLVHLFLGRALCFSHHFRDLANQELPRPYSVQISRGESVFVLLNSVSDPTISARSNADPEVNSL
jgi:hypothetical protein